MKKILNIIAIISLAAIALAQEHSEGDSAKKSEIVRDEASGAMTVGAPKLEAARENVRSEAVEDRGSFDLGGFLKELFEAEAQAPRRQEPKADYRDAPSEPKPASAPAKSALRATESKSQKPKSSTFDTFKDDNDNGIDDRLEGAKTIEPSRSKK